MAEVTICNDFGAPENSLTLFPLFPHLFPMKWWDRMPWSSFSECWVLNQVFHSSFSFIKRLLSFSSLSALRVVSSAYLRLLIFLPAILIPACASSSPAFLMMYSAFKLNEQGDNIQPCSTPFPIWNLLLNVQFYLFIPDLHTDFSRGRSGGLIFPSLSEFSTVCGDPHSQRLWHSQ